MDVKENDKIAELIKTDRSLPIFLKRSGLDINNIIEADKELHNRLKFSKDKNKGKDMIGILINYTDTIYMFCPVSKRIYYSDFKDIVIDKDSSFHVNEFIKRYKTNKLV